MNTDKLIDKKIYISPYNDIALNLKKNLENKNISISGYIDNNKIGHDIFKQSEVSEYDYIVINSPNYWLEIAQNIKDKSKIILFFSKFYSYHEYLDTLKQQANSKSYDIIFMPHNKAHTLDMIPIVNTLKKDTNYRIAFANIKDRYHNEGAYDEIIKTSIDIVPIDSLKLNIVKTDIFIAMNTWEKRLVKPLIQHYNNQNILTIGIVEGITDFTDVDYKTDREAYQNVKYVLATGKNDLKYLKNKQNFVIGIPKMINLWKKDVVHFPNETLVVINLSFLSLQYNDYGKIWIKNVVEVCNELRLKYIISKHPNDVTDVTNYNVTNKTIYEILNEGTLLISRFSTTILESIALGKPVVYFKPQPEKTKLYDNNYGAFSIAKDRDELKEKILYELENKYNVRQRANKFLDEQCNINEPIKPEILASKYITEIISNKV